METPLFLFGYHLLLLVVVVFILFGIGEGLMAALGLRSTLSYSAIIRNVFIGYILSVSVFAIISTRFVSIHVVYILLLTLAVMEARRCKEQIKEIYRFTDLKPNFLVIASLLLLVYCWSWFSIYNPDSVLHFNYYGDNILYSKISKALSETGFENGFYYLNTLDPYYNGPEPYHYFDLWGGSLVAAVFSLNHYFGLQLIIYPLFYFLAALCLYRSASNLSPKYLVALSVLLLFLSGYFAPVYERIRFLGLLHNFAFTIFSPWANKLAFFYIFFLCAVGLYAHGLKNLAVICLMGLTGASIISLPVLVVSLSLVLGYEYMRSSDARRDLRRQFFTVGTTTVVILLFYTIFKRESIGLAGVEITSPVKLLIESLTDAEWITQRNILIGGLLHLAIYYLPLVPVVILFVRLTNAFKENNLIFFGRLLLVIIPVSLVGWALLYREVNAVEVFAVMVIPFINTACALMVVTILSNLPRAVALGKRQLAFALALAAVIVVQQFYNSLPDDRIKTLSRYSNDYLMAVDKVVANRSLRRGASIKDQSMLKIMQLKFNAVYPMGEYLTLMDESVAVVNIGDFNTPIDTSSEMSRQRSLKAIGVAPFYRYATARVGLNPSRQKIDSLQALFVRDFGIEFLILAHEAKLPESLAPRVSSEIIDSQTGEHFVLLASQ